MIAASPNDSHLSAWRLGRALAIVFAVIYGGCVLVMWLLPHDATLWLYNSLSHGVDWEPVIRWDVPLWEILIGIVEALVIGAALGAVTAWAYNLGSKSTDSQQPT